MGAAVARRAHKASWVGLAGLQYLCLTCSESYDRATDRRANNKWFLTQLAKVGLPYSLSLSKPTDNKWKLDYIYYKQYVVNHLFGVGVGEGISVWEASWIITLVICFKLNFFPGGRSLPLFISGTKRLFSGQKDRGTGWRDRKVGQKGIWPGQNGKGTERLGQKGRDRTSRIRFLYQMQL